MKYLILTVATAWSLGCEAAPLPEVTQEGSHVVVAVDPQLRMCGGSLPQMDDFVARLSTTFAIPAPYASERIRFYWLDAEDFTSRTPCAEVFGACARPPNVVYSKIAPINHELVHAVAYSVGYPPPFFSEGLAVAYQGLGDDVQASDLSSFDLDVRGLIEMSGSELIATPGGYSLAGAFTSALIARFGSEAHLAAYAAMERTADSEDVDIVFQEFLGTTLEASISTFEKEVRTSCGPSHFDAKLIECNAPELAWDGDVIEHHRSLSCDQEDAVGPAGGGTVVALRTFTVAEAGNYELRAVGDAVADTFSGISLQHCGNENCLTSSLRASVEDPPSVVKLQPGRYSLRLHGSAIQSTSVGLRVRRLK